MSDILRLARSHFPVTALGYGTRLGIWVQGCPLACPGCIAKDTWDPDTGAPVDVEELLGDVRRALDAGADGVTVSGGEPLEQAAALTTFLQGIRRLSPEFDIMLYTGYELDELDPAQRAAADLADVLITGRYVASAPTRRIWRGSANQVLRPQTALGTERYAEFVDHEPDAPPIQVETTVDGQVFWVGVPNHPETKRTVESALTALGFPVVSTSWRRPR